MSQSRQLAVIIFTDIVGYTELMQGNESDALDKLNRFKAVIEARASENQGKIIQYYGDGCLIIFKSPLEAVTFATALKEDFSKTPLVPVRIGIHLGDLVFKEGNVFGDSVNIASRIESMGVPGAVLLSETVNNQIRNHPQFKTTSLGKFEFKNVDRPIEVFALANDGFTIPKKKNIEGKLKKKNIQKRKLVAAFSIILVIAAAFILSRSFIPENTISEIEKSIAVLPFIDMSPNKDQGYLGDGLAEEIINSLNHIPGLQIAGRTSSFGYKDKRMDLKQIGAELNVGIILEGSVQKSGNKIRITTQLINTKNGYHLWSEHYDREMKDIFVIQDEIARNITERMRLTFAEPVHITRNKSEKVNPQAYDMYLKGLHLLNSDQTEFQKAVPYFENAIHIDSGYALAYAMLGYTYARMGWWDVITPRDAFEKMYAFSKKSIELDPELAIGYAVLASAQLHANYDWKSAEENFEKSLDLDSLNPVALNEYAYYNLYSGDYNTAIRLAEKNVALDPANSFFLIDIGHIYVHAGKPELAQKTYRKIRELYPDRVDGYFEQYRLLANQNKFDAADYYYKKAVERGLKEKTKFTLFGAARLLKEGKQNEALALFNKNKNDIKAIDKAFVFALLNKFDEMMENLQISYLERDDDLFLIKTNKEFNRYVSNPRFMKFIEKLNFPMVSQFSKTTNLLPSSPPAPGDFFPPPSK
jgi:adenylate cyclase